MNDSLNALMKQAKDILRQCGGDQAEVTLQRRRSGLTRFANSAIHQNVDTDIAGLTVRVIDGNRIGTASARGDALRDGSSTADEALDIARRLEPTPGFESLPSPTPIAEAPSFDEATAAIGPAERAGTVARFVSAARAAGADAAGSYATSWTETVIVNSLGVESTERSTRASGTAMFLGGEATSYDQFQSSAASKLDIDAIAAYLAGRYKANHNAVAVEPGEYTVVLEPKALATLLGMAAFIGFGAAAYAEGRSFVSGRLGEKIMGDNVTVWDDASDPAGMPTAFDGEGVPKQKVALIESGVARNVVYDSLWASREGAATTGHAIGGASSNPLPLNLIMAGGAASMDALIGGVKRGLLVSRFHYTNVAEPNRAVLTGMTRDGTFLIEGGQIVRAVKNLRYTQSALDAFSQIASLCAERRCVPEMGNPVVPAARIEGFRFTGVTG